MNKEMYAYEKEITLIKIDQITKDIKTFHKMEPDKKSFFLIKQLENKLGYYQMKYDIYNKLICEEAMEKQRTILNEGLEIASEHQIKVVYAEQTIKQEIEDLVPSHSDLPEKEEKIYESLNSQHKLLEKAEDGDNNLNEHLSLKDDSDTENEEHSKPEPETNKEKGSKRILHLNLFNKKEKKDKPKKQKISKKQLKNKDAVIPITVKKPIKKERSIEDFQNKGFTSEQLNLISEGLAYGMDVDKFAQPERPVFKMRKILSAMKKGYNVDSILNQAFTEEQLDILIICMENKFDITEIANPSYSSERMTFEYVNRQRKVELTDTVYEIDDFNDLQLMEIKNGVRNKVNVYTYFSPAFTEEQMSLIRRGEEKGIDTSKYAYPEYDAELMREYFYKLDK